MKKLTTVLLLLSIIFAQAQIGNVINFNKAKRLMSLDAYQEALSILDSLKSNNPENYNLDYLIGKCYLNQTYDKVKAIPYLEKAKAHISKEYKNNYKNMAAPQAAYYDLAKSYLLNYQLDQVISIANEYQKEGDNQQIQEKLDLLKQNAKNAKNLMLMPIKIKIDLLSLKINSKQDDYTALVNADETVMVFTSRRKGSTGGLKNDEGKYYEDVYISYKQNGEWTAAQNMGEAINTDRHDACVALSADGESLIIYRDDYGIGNLYISTKDSLGWTKAKKMSQNINSNANETHAAFSHDGQALYFVSDIKDGEGGKDIYVSYKLPNGDWAYPQNLGNNINTEFDEDGVFIHPDGQKLFFSSKGHKSMGGYDIFYCDLIGDSIWSKPKNMGYPINTTSDDMFAVFSADDKRAYYSANKKDGFGAYDIYQMNLMSLPERNNTIIKGYLRTTDGQIIKNKSIKVLSTSGQIIGKYKANKEGLFVFVLQQNQTYQLKVNGLLLKNNQFKVPDQTAFFITQKALVLQTIAQVK